MEVRILHATRSGKYGELGEGQVIDVPQETADHWILHHVAEDAAVEHGSPTKPELPPMTAEGPQACTHPDCVDREPFPNAVSLKGHVTRVHSKGPDAKPEPKPKS